MKHAIFLSDLITSLPEVNGAFLFSYESGIIAKDLDQQTSGFNALAIAKKIAGIAAIASEQLNDITQIEVNFDTMILSGRLLPDQNWLFILHTPELSSGMIKMALQMALKNRSQESDDNTEANQAEPPDEDMVEDVISAQKVKQVDLEVLMSPGAPLAKPLNILQDELAYFIGPVAIPLFQDIVNTWCQEHAPALDTLKYLIPLIEKEIDDTNDTKAFHANIKNLIPQE